MILGVSASTTAALVGALILSGCAFSNAQTVRDHAWPSVTISTVPHRTVISSASSATEPICGNATGVDFLEYRIVIYAQSLDNWWLQKTGESPLIDIDNQGSWHAMTHLGVTYAAVLVPRSYNPPASTVVLPPTERDMPALALVQGRKFGTDTHYCVQLDDTIDIRDDVRVSISKAVNLWQNENDFSLTEDAQKLVAQGFADQRDSVKMLLRSQPNAESLFNAMIENYLFDVRDQRIHRLRSRAVELWPEYHLQRVGLPQHKESNRAIQAEDIRHFPPSEFIQRHIATWNAQPLGELDVISEPDGAEIAINRAYSGYTCKKFVVSEGHYAVHIAPTCDTELDVLANRPPARAFCGKSKTCKNWNQYSP